MRKTAILIVTTFALMLMVVCCKSKKEQGMVLEGDQFQVVNLDSLSIEPVANYSSIFKGVKVLTLETNKQCLIGEIQKVELCDSDIYVLDITRAKALYVFDIKGKFKRRIGVKGKGPGEYFDISSYSIDKNNGFVFLLDGSVRKVIQYTLLGEFVNEFELNKSSRPHELYSADSLLFIDHYPTLQQESETLLKTYDYYGNCIDGYFRFPEYNHGLKLPMSTGFVFSTSNNNTKYCKPFSDTIFSISKNGITPFLAFQTNKTITKEEMNKINSGWGVMGGYSEYKGFKGASIVFECDSLLWLKFDGTYTNNYLYWPKLNESAVVQYLKDDITFKEPFNIFKGSYANQVISSVDGWEIEAFIENVRAGKIVVAQEEKEKIEKLTPESNPILLFYECRSEMKRDLTR